MLTSLPSPLQCAEEYVQFCCKAVLESCIDDMEFLGTMYDKTAIDRVKAVAETPFKRLPYTEAIEILMEHVQKGKTFEFPVGEWRCE